MKNYLKDKRKSSFDNIAKIYENARPGYPNEMYEEIEKHFKFGPNSKILEIGAGDGKATIEMNKRWNSHFTVLEPGPKFYKLLQKKFIGKDNVKIIRSTFESYALTELYDCVISATAFHWIPKEIGYKKTACLLKAKGLIVLFWNNFSRNDDSIFDEIQEIYRLYYPEDIYEQDIRKSQRKKTDERRMGLEESRCFKLISHQEYIHSKIYTADGYIELLKTFSDNSIKNIESLSTFYRAIKALIKKNGDKLELPIHVNLEIGEKIS